MTTAAFKRTALYSAHQQAGARLIEFGGWEMPVEYKGLLHEHHAVRNHAGLFDVSHMGQIFISGPDAEIFLRKLLPNDVAGMNTGDMRYSPMCQEDGGIIDDLMVTKLDDERYLFVVNAATCEGDWEWIKQRGKNFIACEKVNRSAEFAMLALQGPEAERILQDKVNVSLADMSYMTVRVIEVDGMSMLVSRSGYTGEDGFELICRTNEAEQVWKSLLASGAEPVGLGARDTLRLEMGYCLYGNDIDRSTTPIDASLNWTVKMTEGREFIGMHALQEQKQKEANTDEGRRLVGILIKGKGIPRPGQKIFDGDREIGSVTSGTFSPTRKEGIALGYVARSHRKTGTPVQIEIRNRRVDAEVNRPPFVPPRTKSSK